MMTPNYQHIRADQMPVVTDASGNIHVKVVAGDLEGEKGLIATQTEVNVFMIETTGAGVMEVSLPVSHESCLYVLDGEVIIQGSERLLKNENQIAVFNKDGKTIRFESTKSSKFLVLSGDPINEKVAQYGPYVMNTQTELLEAMRDYQQGKMGHLY